MAIDFTEFTMGEIANIEQLSGQPIGSLTGEDKPQGFALAAIAFTVKKREEPEFTWNDALGLTFKQVQAVLGLDDEPADAPTETPLEDESAGKALKTSA